VVANPAAFKIQGTPSADPTTGDRIYRARSGENLAIQLEQNPASDVLSVTYQLYDPTNSNAPLASLSARGFGSPLIFTENSGLSYTPQDKQAVVHVQMPSAGSLPGAGTASWVVRAVAVTASGSFVFDRGVALNSFPESFREVVPAERSEFYALGYERTFGAQVANAFPIQRKFVKGSSNSIVVTNVCAITPTPNREAIAIARVQGSKSGAGDSIWKLESMVSTDDAGVVTLNANANVSSKSAGGTQVADTDFVPTIAVVANQVVVALNQQQAGTYPYRVWLELLEEPL
jgi:hypothetical protein